METPREIGERFLRRLSESDAEGAAELFVDDPIITRPGKEFSGPEAFQRFRASADGRYREVDKEFDRWIATDTHAVSTGTLCGVDNDGDAFEGVRYVDVFEVEDGEIVRLDVWNDAVVEGVVDE